MPCDELCETGEPVSDAFDRTEPRGTGAKRREEGRQDCGCGFVAPVAEQAGEAHAENGAVEPGWFFCGLRHEEAVYSCQYSVKSSGKQFRQRLLLGGAVEDNADFLEGNERIKQILPPPTISSRRGRICSMRSLDSMTSRTMGRSWERRRILSVW